MCDVLLSVIGCWLQDGYVFHVVIGCIHEIALSKAQILPDGRVKPCSSEAVSEVEYQLVTLPRLTSLLHGCVIATRIIIVIIIMLVKMMIITIIIIIVVIIVTIIIMFLTIPAADSLTLLLFDYSSSSE